MENNILSKKSIRQTYPICVLFAFVMNMTFSVDSIISGKFLSTDAVAAVGIGTPFITLMLAVLVLILQGCFLKMIQYMGRSDKYRTCKIYSSAIVLIFSLGSVFMLLCIFANSALVNAGGGLKASAEAGRIAGLYIMSASGMVPFFAAGLLFQYVLASYGYQQARMLCGVVNVLVNIVVSIIGVIVLPSDIAIVGLGIGSAFGCFVQALLAFILVKKKCKNIHFVFFKPGKEDFLNILDMFRRGLPSSVNTIIGSIASSIINHLVLSLFVSGTEIVALIVIVKTMKNIAFAFSKAAAATSEPLFGILFNNRDVNGLIAALRDTIKIGLAYTLGISVLMIIIHPAFMVFYNQSGNQLLRAGLIMIAIATPIDMIIDLMGGFFEATERFLLSMSFTIIADSILYPIMVVLLSKAVGPAAVWIGMSFNGIVFLAIFYLIMMVATKKFPVPVKNMLMIKKELLKHIPSLDMSINGDESQITKIAETIQNFFTSADYNSVTAYNAALCMEEIAADYADFTKTNNKKEQKLLMDIKVFLDEDDIEMIIRSYDEPYNSLDYEYNPETFSKIGVYMIQKIAKQISYSYAYHLNIITIKLAK